MDLSGDSRLCEKKTTAGLSRHGEETMHATTSADPETQERTLQLRKQILKLRWIGMEREAEALARSAHCPDILLGEIADRD
jgi:hypothetical protein